MNRYVVSAIAIMASTGMAFAQGSPSSQPAQSSPSGGASQQAPGQTNSADSPAKSVAPGQTKEPGSSAADQAPGRTKTGDRMEGQDKATGGTKAKASDRRADDREKAAEDKGKAKSERSETRSAPADQSKSSESKGADKADRGEPSKRTGEAGSKKEDRAAGVELKPEQKTKVITTFKKHRVQPAKNVNINVAVGTVVPRTVELHPIPRDILVIAPAYEGYRYFVVDDRIIIVEASTHRIVDVLVIA